MFRTPTPALCDLFGIRNALRPRRIRGLFVLLVNMLGAFSDLSSGLSRHIPHRIYSHPMLIQDIHPPEKSPLYAYGEMKPRGLLALYAYKKPLPSEMEPPYAYGRGFSADFALLY
jgi:hypothetical protein